MTVESENRTENDEKVAENGKVSSTVSYKSGKTRVTLTAEPEHDLSDTEQSTKDSTEQFIIDLNNNVNLAAEGELRPLMAQVLKVQSKSEGIVPFVLNP